MEGVRNKDGFGYTYVNKDGKFVTRKFVMPFSALMKRDLGILAHMPFDGWTIAHQRAASCGAISRENSHPFEIDNKWAICHNGAFHEHDIVGLALSKIINPKGQTDSEIAANLINIVSPRVFAMSDSVINAGVYLCLNTDGSLEVIKNSGELSIFKKDNDKVILSSELSWKKYFERKEASRGWYKFDKNGVFVDFVERKWETFYKGYKKQPWLWGGGSDYAHRDVSGNVEGYSVVGNNFHDGRHFMD